jgi:hypothetical protein
MSERVPGEDDLDPDRFELAQFNEAFEAAEDPSLPVPDGTYTVWIERIEKTTARVSGNPILRWSLPSLGPRCVGRRLWRSHALSTPEQFGWLKRDLALCNIRLHHLSDLHAHLPDLIGLELRVSLRTIHERQSLYFERCLGPGPNFRRR